MTRNGCAGSSVGCPGVGRPLPGRPVRGGPVRGRPVRGRLVRGRPGVGRPLPGRPVRGRPVRGRPVRGRPVRGCPVRGRPVRGCPVRGRPVRGRPGVGRPVRGCPGVGRPLPGRPVRGRPVRGRPVRGCPVAVRVLALALLACCAAAPRGPGTASPASAPRVVALISANAEWKIVRAQFPDAPLHESPYGPWLVRRVGAEDVVFFHGGYGKVAAAGSTQYAIDRWRPALLVNLGTCGGFGGRKVGDLVLASETVIYDIIERMGDPEAAIADFRTRLDPSVWPARLASRVTVGRIVSADRDLDPAAVAARGATYGATVGDWESGAIAWVAARNRIPALILRGVTDIVDAPGGNPAYATAGTWERASVAVMASLIALFDDALPELVR